MKRILAVLLFVAAASIGFSVSGQVYTEIRDNGPSGYGVTNEGVYFYTQEPWSTGSVTPLDDLRCGRQGTGVDLNFDSFTLTYKLRDMLNGVQGPTSSAFRLTLLRLHPAISRSAASKPVPSI